MKLSELTVAEFIDLICGEFENLRSLNQSEGTVDKAATLRNVIFEYKEIADPSSVRQYLSLAEDMIKARVELVLFSLCSNLVDLHDTGRVREILAEYGINAQSMSDLRIGAEVKSRLERARSKAAELQDRDEMAEPPTVDEIRRQFDEQTAALMAHFKFQIDTSSMKATVYAHLVARHNREIKAKLSSLKKK